MWTDTKEGKRRLALEHRAMLRFHPQFALHRRPDGSLYYRGALRTSLSGRSYEVHVVFAPNHPTSPPGAYIASPTLPAVPHRYSDGKLCLFMPGDGPTGGYNPAATTAATIVGWASQWLHALEIWQRTACWPGRDAHRR